MSEADSSPQWADGDCCYRCRVQFNLVQRKHHCRHCGQIFCAKCSSKQAIIPKYGLDKEVRVCEDCYEKINNPSDPDDVPAKPKKSEQELQEEEELQLAIALSASEAEFKEKKRGPATNYSYSQPISNSPSSVKFDKLIRLDSDVEKYLDRDFWESKRVNTNRSTSPAPSAPSPHYSVITSKSGVPKIDDEPKVNSTTTMMLLNKQENGVDGDIDTFLGNLKSALEIFVNRMNSNQIRGRPIANDTAVQSLFLNITNMHSQLLRHIQEQDDGRLYYEGLQDKLGQIRDARAALDALREEHLEKLRLETEEAERQRQAQMAQKLEIMRKKKNEYLQYQRQMALQRIQEQEREMLMRQEQQKYHLPQGSQANPQYPSQTGSIGYAAPTPGSQPLPPQGPVVYQSPAMNHGPQPPIGQLQMVPPTLQQTVTSSPSRSPYIGPQGPIHQPPVYQMQPPYGSTYAPMMGPGIPMAAPLPQSGPDHNLHPPQPQQQQPPPPQPDTYSSNNQAPIEEPLISFD